MKTHVGRGAGAFIEPKLFTAERTAWVCSPWLSPPFAQRLTSMAKKGVEVRVITSDDSINHDSLKILRDAAKPERDLLGRVKKDWKPPSLDYLIIKTGKPEAAERGILVHAKMYVVDSMYAVTGSANCTEAGFYHNLEHLLIFEAPEEVEQIEEDFATLWKLYREQGESVVKEYYEPLPSRILSSILERIKLRPKQ